jgi:GNAT superfamily N-acetyltransferase
MNAPRAAGPPAGAASVTVRLPRREEVGRVWELVRGLADYERMTDRVSGSAEALETALFAEGATVECLVADRGGELIGYALFYPTFSSFRAEPMMWLEDLFVEPHRRGHGAGKALFLEVVRRAVARRCWRLDWYVLDWNEPAIGFYEQLGATRIAQEWHHYGLGGKALAAAAAIASEVT